MGIERLVQYLLLPLRLTGLLLVGTMSVVLVVAAHAGLLGIPIALVSLVAFIRYAYALLESVANGATTIPVLSIDMITAFDGFKSLLHLFLAILAAAETIHLLTTGATWSALILGLLAVLVLPASIAVLGLTDSVLQALNPLMLWRVVRGLRGAYPAVLAVMLCFGVLIYALARLNVPSVLGMAALMLALLSLYALTGGALYEARHQLGNERVDPAEFRQSARLSGESDGQREQVFDAIYAQARSGNLTGAWNALLRELEARRHAPEFCDWLLARLATLERLPVLADARVANALANRLAREVVSRSLDQDADLAVRVVRGRLGLDPNFRPRSAAETKRVAGLAQGSGDPALARTLLADFARHFPG